MIRIEPDGAPDPDVTQPTKAIRPALARPPTSRQPFFDIADRRGHQAAHPVEAPGRWRGR